MSKENSKYIKEIEYILNDKNSINFHDMKEKNENMINYENKIEKLKRKIINKIYYICAEIRNYKEK